LKTRLVLAALLVLVLSGGLVLALRPVGGKGPHAFNRDRNAVWLEHRWLEKEHTDAEMDALLTTLAGHGVRYVFPHLIPFDGAGRLPLHSREQAQTFLSAARRASPDMKVLPWVGGLRVGHKRTRPGNLDLADLGQRQRMVAECRGLVDDGFDGIHLDVEPVDDGNSDFLALLRALRTAVGSDRILSVSAIKPGPLSLPMAPNLLWTPDYYTRIARSADQIVVMTYDTGLPTAALYSRYVAYATGTLSSALASSHARLLVGIPTYAESGFMHRAGVETPENALRGVVAGLRRLPASGPFDGVALYAGWTTDDAKWAIYERVWRQRAP